MEFFGRFLSDAADDESKRRDLFGTALSAFCQALFSSAELWRSTKCGIASRFCS
jgi:DNA-binding ferritin-like protein (Dps family)